MRCFIGKLSLCRRSVLSYVAIGAARSVEDQHHRMTVSGMTVPTGMKNPTSGDLSVMFNSVKAAQSQTQLHLPRLGSLHRRVILAHVVLRGATGKHGDLIPNYLTRI